MALVFIVYCITNNRAVTAVGLFGFWRVKWAEYVPGSSCPSNWDCSEGSRGIAHLFKDKHRCKWHLLNKQHSSSAAANRSWGVENCSGCVCCLETHTLIYEPKIGLTISTLNVFSMCVCLWQSLSRRSHTMTCLSHFPPVRRQHGLV